ncbi:hypothetical protein OSB04_015776 [Centaurea solstitialis]|uniref:EF-hand domain-containing protein n=1 Tax=Centaurea solstitialis TaxID=347529 RepID=A0AA38TCZ8_9ASTR|nr:hypothetical protein OSB04_015776 [Centaurea solstitialis]
MNMGKLLLALVLSLLVVNVAGRHFHGSYPELVSDGISSDTQKERSSFLRLEGMDSSEEYYCSEQMYGFLPCSSTLVGHFFLIVVYEYLLFQGESLVVCGGSRLFEILGPGVFGASAFPVLDPLPESLIVLGTYISTVYTDKREVHHLVDYAALCYNTSISGLLASKEEAQEYVITGVGLLAGSTIFLLTLLWGTCVIVGSENFHSDPTQSTLSSLPWSGSGVTTDVETSETARFMLVSLVPFIVILIPKIFDVSSSSGGYKIDILITLIFAAIILLAHVYKMSDEQVQVRRLRYVEVEHELLVFDMIQRMQEHISKPLVTEGGAPNEAAIKWFFLFLFFPFYISSFRDRFKGVPHIVTTVPNTHCSLFKKMDHNGDNHLSYLELKELLEKIKLKFHDRVTKWINEIRGVLNEPARPETRWQLLTKPFRVFKSIDEDHDNSITLSELRNKFMEFNLADMKLDEGDAAEKIMNHFDKNKNGELDLEEFIAGIKQWHELPLEPAPTSCKHPNAGHQLMMNKVDRSLSARAIATMLLLLGIAILVLLAEPLIQSVHKFSTSVGIPSFYVGFILVPLATNARTAISAIKAVSQKKQMPFKKSQNKQATISLTFSEIYHGVLMNNILGMLVLSSIIYFRGLTWNFFFEVLTVLVVCVIMGLLASFRSKFPIWTSFFAYMLYVLSLILIYVLHGAFQSP